MIKMAGLWDTITSYLLNALKSYKEFVNANLIWIALIVLLVAGIIVLAVLPDNREKVAMTSVAAVGTGVMALLFGFVVFRETLIQRAIDVWVLLGFSMFMIVFGLQYTPRRTKTNRRQFKSAVTVAAMATALILVMLSITSSAGLFGKSFSNSMVVGMTSTWAQDVLSWVSALAAIFKVSWVILLPTVVGIYLTVDVISADGDMSDTLSDMIPGFIGLIVWGAGIMIASIFAPAAIDLSNVLV